MGEVLIGPAGWSYKDWEGKVYPQPPPPGFDPLAYLAQYFRCIEVNSSFYRPPSARMSEAWAARTPDSFVFTVKAWERFTHDKETFTEADARLFQEGIAPLLEAGKLGAILLQYPEWFAISRANKDEILHARELLPDDRLAVEFRNATWMSERNRVETLSFLEEHGLTYVAVDEPQGFPSSMPPVAAVTNDALAIVRFHGRNAENWKKPGLTAAERFDYSYKKKELEEWLPKIREMAERAKEIHLLMNNCYGDKAVNNAAELAELLN